MAAGIEGPGGTFLGAAHTLRHVRKAAAAAAPQAVVGWRELVDRYERSPFDPAVEEALTEFVERRTREILRAA